MINATLGPPPAAAGSTAPADTPPDANGAPEAASPDRDFHSALAKAATGKARTPKGPAHNDSAAGPDSGKLHQTDADAAGQDTTTGAATALRVHPW